MTSQQKFFLFAGQEDFDEFSGRVQWRADQAALMLGQNQAPRLADPSWEEAQNAWENASPLVVDAFGAFGEIIDDGDAVAAALGFRSDWNDTANQVKDQHSNPIVLTHGKFTDLSFGGDSRLALCISDTSDGDEENNYYGLGVFHLRKRWFDTVPLPEAPVRVWTDAQDRSWVLCESIVVQCAGHPLPHAYHAKADRFEPENLNPQALRVIHSLALPTAIVKPLSLCEDGLNLYVLAETQVDNSDHQQLFVHPLPDSSLPAGQRTPAEQGWITLDLPPELTYATDIHPLAENHIAAMLPQTASDSDFRKRDCPILQLIQQRNDETDVLESRLKLVQERYPMLSQERARFASSDDRKLRYFSDDGPRELFPLAQARFVEDAQFNLARVLDSGTPATQWHKIVLEACIPRGCKVGLSVHCSDEKTASAEKDFLPQHKPLWRALDSELPFQPGWHDLNHGEHGVFEVLLQRPAGEVRELRGRYLQLRLELSGDGRSSPAIHAIRVYYPRLCWQENFLPQHFHQQKSPDTSDTGPANGADIRQRIFASLESMLTPIEDRISAAEILFNPQAAPSTMLPIIASSLGITDLPALWPEHRQRRLIEAAGALQQRHGTFAGLVLALDIATDGAVAAGKIVPLENFRFRRTLATILGVSFDDQHHPLTLGSGQSGNSIVGDSLILTKEGAREFLALLSPDSYATASDEEEASSQASSDSEEKSDTELVYGFFHKYAHRITVLLHGDARRWRHNVDAVLRKHAPAHLQWTVKMTDHPFVPGLAPLLQIDTYLEHQPPAKRVVLNQTILGREGLVRNKSALSP